VLSPPLLAARLRSRRFYQYFLLDKEKGDAASDIQATSVMLRSTRIRAALTKQPQNSRCNCVALKRREKLPGLIRHLVYCKEDRRCSDQINRVKKDNKGEDGTRSQGLNYCAGRWCATAKMMTSSGIRRGVVVGRDPAAECL